MGLFSILAAMCGIAEFYFGLWCYRNNHKGPADVGYRTHVLMGLFMMLGSVYLCGIGI
jgi:hypothetical protein